ncbi:Hypothetical protein NTJ_02457 [Nesidiocoris tenuis]|uniref:MADF domain-containing protein n=1 Tax=Nesidiocoris tenuis TaxID=355587 RepID=A0ABN7ABF6_9HEMI|nr:Hypothetical protein NTJ_02457 [Nesidiocoris tenuis]
MTSWTAVGKSGCKSKWTSMRDAFSRSHRKKEASKTSGAGPMRPKKKYKRYGLMTFLLPSMKQAESITSCPAMNLESQATSSLQSQPMESDCGGCGRCF